MLIWYVIEQANVRLMVDAEHSYFQPAIDHAAMELQRTYNRQKPTVLNTYQCYLQVCRSWTFLRGPHDFGPSSTLFQAAT